VVQSAIRLGWYLAEVRGRNRPDPPPGAAPKVPPRTNYPLPLRIERSPDEQRDQAEAVLFALVDKLAIDSETPIRYGEALRKHLDALADLRATVDPNPADVVETWNDAADWLWRLDAHIQDVLTAGSDTQACGYQLGRGLAECYWALDPGSAEGWDSWTFLFDQARCGELSRLAGRLSGYMQPFGAPAITGSLEVWKELAGDPGWRVVANARDNLYGQIRTWYELLVLGKDPTTDIRPYQLIKGWRPTLRAAMVFLPQLVLAGIGVAGTVLLLLVLSADKTSHLLATLSGVVAALGLSVAGITAKVKSQAQAVGSRLRQDVYTDLIAVAITNVPRPPDDSSGRKRQAIMERAVRRRKLTTSTPMD
jgi:hypothetical protein